MSALNLPTDVMEAVVAKAILDQIGPEERDAIISDAITKMIAVPEKVNSWDRTPTKSLLRMNFESAVETGVAREVNRQITEDPAVQAAIRGAVSPVIADIAAGNYDGLPDAIGAAVGTWLRDRAR